MSKQDIKRTITDICDNRLKALGEYDFFKDASLEIKFWRITGLVNNDIEGIIDRCEESKLDTLISEFTYYIPSGSAFEGSDSPGPGPDPYASKYFTTEMVSSGTISLQIGANVSTEFLTSISYRVNGGEWVETSNVDNQQVLINISANTDDIVEWKGTGVSMDNPAGQTAPDPLTYMSYFTSGEDFCDFNVYGNIMSLLYGDDFESQKTISAPAAFSGLFINNSCLYSAENLILPATTISFGCYFNMFSGCTNLTTAPKTISATTLASNCCDSMFYGCTSLTTAPELPATTLANYCCWHMFANCTLLTTAPELPATTLKIGCYENMFSGCTSLTTAPKLPATTLANYCYSGMFYGCTSLTTAPELPATTLADYCYFGMFSGCTSLTTAPELPATTLTYYCYNSMFYNCTSLTTAPELPATTLADYCYQYMFNGCTSLTTCPELPATTLADSCYRYMFYGCTSLTTGPELPATTLVHGCYSYMFEKCTSLTTAPELPATTLAEGCYSNMFGDCTSLNYIKCLATNNISVTDCTYNWVFNVASSGTFIKDVNTNWSSKTGNDGIPSNWKIAFYGYDDNINYALNNNLYLESGFPYILDDNFLNQFIGYDLYIDNIYIGKIEQNSHGNYYSYYTYDDSQDSQDYLTFEAIEDTTFTFSQNALQYSIDNGTSWTTLPAGTASPIITAGNKIMWKQTGLTPNTSNGIGTFSSTGRFNAYGNVMSLYYGDNFANQTDLTVKENAFRDLFHLNNNLVNASNLILPATTLTRQCYQQMFQDCTSLTTAPELPATTLAYGCYYSMFYGCTSLTSAPELPAATLANQCYQQMFQDCTSLTTAPELPATTLTSYCYYSMFYGCTSLTSAPELPATTLAINCYQQMFRDCTSLKTAPELPATTLKNYCYNGMFRGCTLLTAAPELPATTLANYCYGYMFDGCTKLNYIKALFTTTPGSSYTDNWLNNVSATGAFFKNFAATWDVSGASGVPNGWTITLNEFGLKYLTTESLESGTIGFTIGSKVSTSDVTSISYRKNGGEWVTTANEDGIQKDISVSVVNGDKIEWKGTANKLCIGTIITHQSKFSSTGNFNVYGNSMSLLYGDNFVDKTSFPSGSTYTFGYLFNGCTKLISVENLILPATTLVEDCYYGMFQGCTSLTTAPELPATTLASYCYNAMFKGCTSLTTAPELPATTLASQCYQIMFRDCTSLTTAPELPATTLASYCYSDMFHGCTSLTTAPELPATTLADSCYLYMFQGCISLTTAPELPATTLAYLCYGVMFSGCTSLNYIKALFTTTPGSSYTSNWLYNVSATGTFVKNSSATWDVTGASGIPQGWDIRRA